MTESKCVKCGCDASGGSSGGVQICFNCYLKLEDKPIKGMKVSDVEEKTMNPDNMPRNSMRNDADTTKCTWEEQADCWESDCGNHWIFFDGSPSYNDFIYCPFCAKPIIEKHYE